VGCVGVGVYVCVGGCVCGGVCGNIATHLQAWQ
jgi:hypothetical protein